MQFAALAVVLLAHHLYAAGNMDVLYQWTDVDFEFQSSWHKHGLTSSGAHIPGNAVPVDVDTSPHDPRNRVFVTTPRFLPGVPATLATVVEGSGLLRPYPDWGWHRQGDCDGITSVLRVAIDRCGQLWVLDSGVVDVFTNESRRICQPQLLVFNVSNDAFLWRYRIPGTPCRSLLSTVAVDLSRGCKDAFVYMADVQGYNLVVLDAPRPRSWVVKSNYFYPSPSEGHFDLNGQQFDLMDGVLSLALSPPQNRAGDRLLYFHSLASRREAWVSTAALKSGNTSFEQFHVSTGTRSAQAGPSAMDSSGSALFFSTLPDNSLNCWNPAREYTADNIERLYSNDVTFQFASGLKVIADSTGREQLLVLTSRLQNVINGKIDRNAVNYRVLRGPVNSLVEGTSCSKQWRA